jgi:cobalt-zinc-cadmium efflux system protein
MNPGPPSHGHDCIHDHDHGFGRRHSNEGGAADFGVAFRLGIALNLAFVLIEAAYGFRAGSVALISDAGHNLGDALGLGAAWFASALVRRAPSERYTYGLRGSSILAALFNAVFLMATVGAISLEAIQRLAAPALVAGLTMTVVAAIGVAVNGVSAALFASGRKGDINIRGAFLHMASDALVSAGVVLAGLVILLTGWLWLDPAVSLAINAVIAWGTWGLLRESLDMSMAGVPAAVDAGEVRAFLAAQPGVDSVHDLHVWSMSTTETALTCHLVMPGGHPGDVFLHALAADLEARFRIGHSTVQIETDPGLACALAPDEVV